MSSRRGRGDTKEKLLRAAARVFAEKGYLAATIREICQAAGANIAAVNYHFGDKRRLYDAVLRGMFRECASASDRARDRRLPVEERISIFIHDVVGEIYGYSESSDDYGQLAAIFHMELAHPSASWPQLVREHLAGDSLLLQELVAEMLGPGADPELVRQSCISINGMMAYHALCWPIISVIHQDHPEPRAFHRALAGHIAQFALAALRGLAAERRGQRA